MSSHLKRHPLTNERLPSRWDNRKPRSEPPSRTGRPPKRRARQWKRLRSWLDLVWVAILTATAIVGGAALHKHFAPKEALCNTIGGELLQQHDTGILTKCGVSSLLSQLSLFVYWAGLVMAVLIGAVLLWWAAVSVRKPRQT